MSASRLSTSSLSAFLLLSAAHAQQTWTVEAEAAAVSRDPGVGVVDDPAASGGQALEVPAEGVRANNVVYCNLPPEAAPGRYVVRLRLRYPAPVADIGRAWRLDVASGDGTWYAYGVAYGLYLKGREGFAPFEVPFSWSDKAKAPSFWMRWTGEGGKPSVRLDALEIVRLGDLHPVTVRAVRSNKLRYREGETGTVAVTIGSASDREQQVEVGLQLTHDLDPPADLGKKTVILASGAEQEVVFPLPRLTARFGYGLRAEARLAGQVAAAAEDCFCVHDNPYAVWTGARDEELPAYYMPWQWLPTGAGFTDEEIEQGARHARDEYTTCHEVFSWSPGEPVGLAPDKPAWIRGNGGYSLVNKRELQKLIEELHRHGIGVISYIAMQAMGEEALDLLRHHPGWFLYSPDTGDVGEFYSLAELQRQRAFWAEFDWERYRREGDPGRPGWTGSAEDWKRYKEFWAKPVEEVRSMRTIGYFPLNYKWPEVVSYCADQAIASAKMFGWDGLRWDCGHLNTGALWGPYAPFHDFYGRPLAKTPEEMVQQTVINLQALKSKVRQALPGYVFGTNYGSWEETHRFPEMTRELCRDGGWMLDEIACTYNDARSPYRAWDKYYAVMADTGEHVTSLGGIYHPFAPNRQGSKVPADHLYDTILRLTGHGHPNSIHYNSRLPAGNYAQFCVRFGRFVFDPAMRRVESPREIVRVDSPRPVWWEKSVGRLTDGGAEYRVIHLINPPVMPEIEANPDSRLPDPIGPVQVATRLPAGAPPARAFLLTAEALRWGDPPRTQAVPLEVKVNDGWATVTVPELLYWKMVVWRLGG